MSAIKCPQHVHQIPHMFPGHARRRCAIAERLGAAMPEPLDLRGGRHHVAFHLKSGLPPMAAGTAFPTSSRTEAAARQRLAAQPSTE